MIGKNSLSMAGIKKRMMEKAGELEKVSGVRFLDMYLCDTFEQWQHHIRNWPADFIYLTDTSRIHEGDIMLSSEEIVRWTVENAKVPVIAANEKDTEAGAVYSIVISENETGLQIGVLVLEILSGTPVSKLPYRSSTKGRLVINTKTVTKMGLEIPYDILSIADKIYE